MGRFPVYFRGNRPIDLDLGTLDGVHFFAFRPIGSGSAVWAA
jgi:hypothetical protein